MATYNITARINQTLKLSFSVKLNGAFISLNKVTGKMQIRQHMGSPIALLELSTSNNGIYYDSSNDKLGFIRAEPTQLQQLRAGSYYYDMVLLYNGDYLRVLEGKFSVIPGVTEVAGTWT